jgi:DNA-binding transcriptional ArsR family regulator
VSQHLKILKGAHLVRELRLGTRHYFGLDPTGFAGLREYADSMWQEALNAFAAYAAEQHGSGAISAAPPGSTMQKRKR